jgi:hypothetical protein
MMAKTQMAIDCGAGAAKARQDAAADCRLSSGSRAFAHSRFAYLADTHPLSLAFNFPRRMLYAVGSSEARII